MVRKLFGIVELKMSVMFLLFENLPNICLSAIRHDLVRNCKMISFFKKIYLEKILDPKDLKKSISVAGVGKNIKCWIFSKIGTILPYDLKV